MPAISAFDWCVLLSFGLASFYAGAGTLILFLLLKNNGAGIPTMLGGLVAFWYYLPSQRIRSKRLSALTITVLIAFGIAASTAYRAYHVLDHIAASS